MNKIITKIILEDPFSILCQILAKLGDSARINKKFHDNSTEKILFVFYEFKKKNSLKIQAFVWFIKKKKLLNLTTLELERSFKENFYWDQWKIAFGVNESDYWIPWKYDNNILEITQKNKRK